MHGSFGIVIVAALIGLPGSARGQSHDIDRVGFMAGCWMGAIENGSIEERYTAPVGGLVLGTTRYLRGGLATQFEFTRIAIEDGAVVLTPYPGGERSEHGFRLALGPAGRAVFAAPEHDFPKRIVYAAVAGDSLVARIDGGEDSAEGYEWRMGRLDCN
jgi:hypothetical protein